MKDFDNLKTIYDKIFKNLNGYSASLFEKKQKEQQKYFKNVIYGETPFELFYAFFCIEPIASFLKKSKIFYDLGSGIGNTVIRAYLTGYFDKCVGVELLDSLYNISLQAKQNLINFDKNADEKIILLHDNILNVNLREADSILFCCPNTDKDILLEFEKKFIRELKTDCFIMSIIYPFNDKIEFQLIESRIVKTAWGESPLFLYRKK